LLSAPDIEVGQPMRLLLDIREGYATARTTTTVRSVNKFP
jgi:hypothetical protein